MTGELIVTSSGWVKSLATTAAVRKCGRFGALAGVLAAVAMVAGCASMFARPAPSSLFQLEYTPRPGACRTSFPASVRVWPLEASSPYDQEAMVVLSDAARVRYSSQYSWVAQPGKLVADWLLRDLSQSQLFPSVMTSGETFPSSFDLGGRLFAFSWQRRGDRWEAVLDVEITLVENRSGQPRQVVLRKAYRLVSKPAPEHDPETFARTMSSVVGELSSKLQNDLCTLAGQQSAPSAAPALP
jgi:ABC-type uncharacterized transport system auxiliary subunit